MEEKEMSTQLELPVGAKAQAFSPLGQTNGPVRRSFLTPNIITAHRS